MKLTTVQWNIGGGRVRGEADDPVAEASYNALDLEYIAGILKDLDPDIVTFQETHVKGADNQTE